RGFHVTGVQTCALPICPVAQPAADAAIAQSNAALVRQAFAAWREGRGSLFDLLHEDVEWVVAGTSPVSGRYGSRQAFLEQAVARSGESRVRIGLRWRGW